MEQPWVIQQSLNGSLEATKDLKNKIIKLQDYQDSYKHYRSQVNHAFTYPSEFNRAHIEYLINYSEIELNKFIKVFSTLSIIDQRPYIHEIAHYQQSLKEHRELVGLLEKQQQFVERVKTSTQINQSLFAEYLQSLSWKHLLRGLMLLTGSFIIHLIIGASSRWNMLNVYVTSFYKITSQPYLVVSEDSYASPLSLFCMGLGMRAGLRVNQILGSVKTIVVSVFLAAGTVYISSFMPTFAQCVLFSFGLFPFCICFSFQLVISECFNYYPKHRLIINGFLLLGTGLGHVLFGLVNTQCFNPEDLDSKYGYFGNDLDFIARQTCYLVLVLGAISIALIYPAAKFNQDKQNENKLNRNRLDFQHTCASQKEAVKSKIFWIMVLMIILSTSGNYFLITNFKNLAAKYHKNTLNLAGVLLGFNLANAFSRALWDFLFTKIGFKWCIVIIATLNAVNFGTICFVVSEINIYRIYFIIGGATLGGCMVCFLNFCSLVFGQFVSKQLPGYIWTCYSLANLLQYAIFNSYDLAQMGYLPSCIVLSLLNLISLVVVISTKMQGSWQNKLDLLQAKCCFN